NTPIRMTNFIRISSNAASVSNISRSYYRQNVVETSVMIQNLSNQRELVILNWRIIPKRKIYYAGKWRQLRNHHFKRPCQMKLSDSDSIAGGISSENWYIDHLIRWRNTTHM